MKKLKLLCTPLLILLVALSCKDDDLAPIITFETAGKGAYPRLIEETDQSINLNDFSNAQYRYSIEFVDLEKGAQVAEYNLDVSFEDNNPDNGDQSSGPHRLVSFTAADFQTNGNGFLGLPDITVTAPNLASTVGVELSDILADDVFMLEGSVVTKEGAVFTATNSSAAVNGSAFRGHFDFGLLVFCPSDLAGAYQYRSSDIWCDSLVPDGTVELIAIGNGEYNLSDWSFGAYGVCYESGSVADSEGLIFRDVCSVVSFTGRVDVFSETWTFESEINGNEWKINWSNTFGEAGTGIIIYPEGDWPITLR